MKSRIENVKLTGSIAPSSKSRSARRSSPSTDVEKIKHANATSPEPNKAEIDLSVLAARQQAGVTKKKRQKPISRQQRMRKEKGMARADAVIDQMEKKIRESSKRGKKIKERAASWEDLNHTARSLPEKTPEGVTDQQQGMDLDDTAEVPRAPIANPEDALVASQDPKTIADPLESEQIKEDTAIDMIT